MTGKGRSPRLPRSSAPCSAFRPYLNFELRLALDLYIPHGRPGRCFRNRFRIAFVVLLGLDIRLHIRGGHQPATCPCATSCRPRWCAPQQASIATVHVSSCAVNGNTDARFMRRRKITAPVSSRPAKLQRFLPRSMPSTTILMAPLLLVRGIRTGSLPVPLRGGGPSHKTQTRTYW